MTTAIIVYLVGSALALVLAYANNRLTKDRYYKIPLEFAMFFASLSWLGVLFIFSYVLSTNTTCISRLQAKFMCEEDE